MIRALFLLLIMTTQALAQRAVDPADLTLTVTLETTETTPYQHEMVLLTVHGVYRRHITLEKLEQPDLKGINWMQLGQDHWFESTIDGLKVKNMRRRIALFPENEGRVTIEPFIHHLTLLDEDNKWFEHDIRSEPITLDVQPAPSNGTWWFPVRRLEISDTWSNAPDQLGTGDGVLRIITLTATGTGPDMIPPMPELKSPSAHIFAHPEKKLVELSPDGPITIAFWRWTIKPRTPPSAILEPLELTYFDTTDRTLKTAKISAQRVAIDQTQLPPAISQDLPPAGRLNLFWPAATIAATTLLAFGAVAGRGRRIGIDNLRDFLSARALKRQLRHSSRTRDLAQMRGPARELDARLVASPERTKLLEELEAAIFRARAEPFDTQAFYRAFRATL